jgi:hypothetical protein
MGSVGFFIDKNLPAAVLPWCRLSLQLKCVTEIFLGRVKAAGA